MQPSQFLPAGRPAKAPRANRSTPCQGRERAALVALGQPSALAATTRVLAAHGYHVFTAGNGRQLLRAIKARRPEVIVIDTQLPDTDGVALVRRIRRRRESACRAILLVGKRSDSARLGECLDAGADDLLATPIDARVLDARLRALERALASSAEARRLFEQIEDNERLAESVFSQVVTSRNVRLPGLRAHLRGLSRFSGDVLLTERAASGAIFVLLGDFTGHGLAAALGAMPAAETFRAMAAKGFSAEQILAGINAKLYRLLPTGMFMAVQLVHLDHLLESVVIVNHAMPEVLLVDGRDGRIRDRVASGGLPLGVEPELESGAATRKFRIGGGDRILLCSDGVVEARNRSGQPFGTHRLATAVESAPPGEAAIDAVVGELARFRGQAPQGDDISLVEIPCLDRLLEAQGPPASAAAGATERRLPASDWEFSMTLRAASLRKSDIVPRIFGQVNETLDLGTHRAAVFTVLTELYVNAVDHGVLRLDSALKCSAEGFGRYFQARERRLATLAQGWVRFELRIDSTGTRTELTIAVEDSGPGFDAEALLARPLNGVSLAGRGLRLIRGLATETRFHPPGSRVEAVFRWPRSGGA